jgi:two-component system, LytTR family, sensor kinase
MKRLLLLATLLVVPSVVMAAQLYAGYRASGLRISFAAALLTQLAHWELWALFGPLVWRLAQRWPIAPPRRGLSLARHLAAAPAVAVAVLCLYLAVYHAMLRLPMTARWFVGFDSSIASTMVFFATSYFHVELLIYAGVVAAAQVSQTRALLRAREHDALRLEAELTGARLTALRLQLQPHFLFNALHTVGSLVMQRDNDRAVRLLAELGELLRTTLAQRDTDLVPLREELEHLQRYLRIEEARFGDRLLVEWHVEDGALDALVPPFILQPIVENAFRHGIFHRTDPSVLRIEAVILAGLLHLSVQNDGPPLPESFRLEDAAGFGLKNVAERLRTRMPPGRIDVTNNGPTSDAAVTGVHVALTLPLWAAAEAAEG